MKKSAILLLLLLSTAAFAKKVKFAVDLDTITANATGVHVGGDFQTLAGYAGGDWASNTTVLTQEGSSTIYSVVVDIPAFNKYEYKFLNGDQWYDAEFVPVESRVGYNFDDNRWIYVDSLANDTTFVGAILFSGNAPRGLTLMRFLVDLTNEPSVDPAGVHVAGSFQNWDPALVRLYSFGSNVYEIIAYDTVATNAYKFYNGNAAGTSESVPASCSVSGNRQLSFAKDTVLATVCFSGCSACILNGIAENGVAGGLKLFPNPATDKVQITLDASGETWFDITVLDLTGKELKNYVNVSGILNIDSKELTAGMYFIKAADKVRARVYTLKFIKE
jgi:hypothetical protein